MFGYAVLRSKSQRWIPELRFGNPPLRNFSKSFWEKLRIFLKSLVARLRGRTLQGGVLGALWKPPLRTPSQNPSLHCKIHSKPPSKNPSENPSENPSPEFETFQEICDFGFCLGSGRSQLLRTTWTLQKCLFGPRFL